MAYFIDYKKTYEKFNMLFPFSSNVKVQQAQWEQTYEELNMLFAFSPNVKIQQAQWEWT